MSFYLKGAQKLEDVKVGNPLKVYSYAVNQTIQTLSDCNFGAPLGTKTCLTFWKLPINISLQPYCQECCRNLSSCLAMLKIGILLYKLL